MPLENSKKIIQPTLDEPLTTAVEFPYPPSCDFGSITQEQVNAALKAEIELNPNFIKQCDELQTNELMQLNIEAEIEQIVQSAGDHIKVKDEILQYMTRLERKDQIYMIGYIKRKISEFIQALKQEILDNIFTAHSNLTNEERYLIFLSKLNINVLLKYPIDTTIYRHLVEELFRMYIELKNSSTLPAETLLSIHTHIELFASGFGLKIKFPKELKKSLQDLSENDLENEKIARPMSKQGDNSLSTFTIIPAPNDFPNLEPHKKKALDILEEMRDVVYNSMKRSSSFELYFDINTKLQQASLSQDSKEEKFWRICSSEKDEIDKILFKLNDLQIQLNELLIALKNDGQIVDPEILSKYIKSVELHIRQMWEKTIFPHLLFYGHLIFGKKPTSESTWI